LSTIIYTYLVFEFFLK